MPGGSVSFWAGWWCFGGALTPPESLADPKYWLSPSPAPSCLPPRLWAQMMLARRCRLSLVKPPTPLPRVGVHSPDCTGQDTDGSHHGLQMVGHRRTVTGGCTVRRDTFPSPNAVSWARLRGGWQPRTFPPKSALGSSVSHHVLRRSSGNFAGNDAGAFSAAWGVSVGERAAVRAEGSCGSPPPTAFL